MFKDEVVIHVRSGKGGNGCISFRRERYVPKGGPDGGDGGRGGDVVFRVDPGLPSLGRFHGNQRFAAQDGRSGGGNNRTGKSGEDLVLKVPPGTLLRCPEHGHVLKDLSDRDKPFVFLRGGRGGRGNARFVSSVEQVPRRAEDGASGEERKLILELKMIADVGLIGLPNAGKSTLLSRISKARPEVADYPFTTLVPQLGVVDLDYRRMVFADIPGLIAGAHLGTGLGDRFLRHVERTRVLIHLIDCLVGLERGFEETYAEIRHEIESYSSILAEKPQIVAVTKAELLPEPLNLGALSDALDQRVLLISAHTGQGLPGLLGAVKDLLFEE